MKRVHQPENSGRSLGGSSYDSSDDDGADVFCYSPEDEDQRRRFCDLFALALASSRNHGPTPTEPVTWDAEGSDSDSHPSLESDAEAELLDLFDDEDESGCCVETPLSSPSADGSFETHDATVVQSRKLQMLNRQQRQQRMAIRETNSFCTNHANLLSPDLTIRVEQILKENRQSASKGKVLDKDTKSRKRTKNSKPCNYASRDRSADWEEQDEPTAGSEGVGRNASVMEQLRKLVYKKYETSKLEPSDAESIHSSILPVSPSLLPYLDALRARSPSQNEYPSSNTVSTGPEIEETIAARGVAATDVRRSDANDCDPVLLDKASSFVQLVGERAEASMPKVVAKCVSPVIENAVEEAIKTSRPGTSDENGDSEVDQNDQEQRRNSISCPGPLFLKNELTELVRVELAPQEPENSHICVDVDNFHNHSSNIALSAAAVSGEAETNGSDARVISIEAALAIISRTRPLGRTLLHGTVHGIANGSSRQLVRKRTKALSSQIVAKCVSPALENGVEGDINDSRQGASGANGDSRLNHNGPDQRVNSISGTKPMFPRNGTTERVCAKVTTRKLENSRTCVNVNKFDTHSINIALPAAPAVPEDVGTNGDDGRIISIEEALAIISQSFPRRGNSICGADQDIAKGSFRQLVGERAKAPSSKLAAKCVSPVPENPVEEDINTSTPEAPDANGDCQVDHDGRDHHVRVDVDNCGNQSSYIALLPAAVVSEEAGTDGDDERVFSLESALAIIPQSCPLGKS